MCEDNEADGFILEDSLAVAGATLFACAMCFFALRYFFFFICHEGNLQYYARNFKTTKDSRCGVLG